MSNLIKDAAKVTVLSGFVLFSAYVAVAAWSEPSTAPTGGNASAPLDVSATGQTKAGGLILNTGGAANGLIVSAGKVGIGTTTPAQSLSINGVVYSGTGGFQFPDGTTQASAASVVPAGSVIAYGATTAPSGWLLANGAAVSRTTYATLFAAIGTSFGTGDGSTTFNLPDLRGEFIRGWNNTSGHDPDAASRTALMTGGASGDNIGSYQADIFKSHDHWYYSPSTGANAGQGAAGGSWGGGSNTSGSTPAGGNETRPKNVYLNYIIKY